MAAACITLGSTMVLGYLPFLLAVSLVTGTLTGFVTALLFRATQHIQTFDRGGMRTMDKKDQIILQQLDVIRSMTEHNLRRMGSDFWGTPFESVGKTPAAARR